MSEAILNLGINERDMIKNVYWSSCKVPRYHCQILMKLEFSGQKDFRKILKYQNFMKIRSGGTELSQEGRQAERWTDMTKLIFTLGNFAKAPKKRMYA